MPELPEVESTVRYLRERILHEEIAAVQVHWRRSVSPLSLSNYTKALESCQIRGVERRGKYVVVELSSRATRGLAQLFVLIHLRMSGSLDVVPKGVALHSHDRVVFFFKSGRELRFNDTRKFGRVYIVQDPLKVVGTLGSEPLSADFTPVLLQKVYGRKKGAMKPLLLNQTLVAGIGNIYADEALWRAGLHPLVPGTRVKVSQWELLHQVIQEILREAIAAQGTDFGDGVVEMGSYVPAVYGREGEPCRRCGSAILRIVVGQRGTHFCPQCQPKPRRSRTPKRSRVSRAK